MVIGRTDEWTNPFIPVADQGRAVVWMPLADPIWASGHVSALKAGHMTAFEPSPHASKARLDPPSRQIEAASVIRRRPQARPMIFSPQAALKPSAQGRTASRLRGLTPACGEKRALSAFDGLFRPLTLTETRYDVAVTAPP
jgi:hypothetical protein